jgi:colanic acid biosynthesis protein WcaH
VGLRANEPAKGKWFVPGGVVRKDERLSEAFARIVKVEIGLEASIGDAKFIGVYEHLYNNNVFEAEGFGTHYVVLAHELNLDHRPSIVSDRQHSEFHWMTVAQVISSPDELLASSLALVLHFFHQIRATPSVTAPFVMGAGHHAMAKIGSRQKFLFIQSFPHHRAKKCRKN